MSAAAANATPTPARRVPVRTCVACRTGGGKRGLLRVVRLPEKDGQSGGLTLDPTGKKSGRGAYLCPTPECVATALKRKALERSLKVSAVPPDVADALRAAAEEMAATARAEPPPTG